MPGLHTLNQERGRRAEEVANWYFRLNGFLSIPGFILHPDKVQRFPETEADLIAVRFPYSAEVLGGRSMTDDGSLLQIDMRKTRIVFILAEVKVDVCRINGPWSDRTRGNMQRVIRRLGFVADDQIGTIAESMYDDLRWESDTHIIQYIAVGSRSNDDLGRQYPQLLQITFEQISDFLLRRFRDFPEKLPTGPVHEQWPDFGRYYGEAVRRLDRNTGNAPQRSLAAVNDYIGVRNR
jgi:hypothetical protein